MFHECHCHLMMNGVNYKDAVALHKDEVNKSWLHQTLHAYQQANITFLRDGGDRYGVSQCAKQLAPAYGIDYRSPIFAIYRKGYYGSILGFGFESLKDYRELVTRVKTSGGDFIKLVASGIMDFNQYGVVTTPWNDMDSKDTSLLLKELIHIAHEEGFAVMVHVNTAEQIRNVLLAGADSIEHGYYMDADCMQLLKESDTVWVPTLSPTANLRHTGMFNEEVLTQIVDGQMNMVSQAINLGIPLAVGSDAGAICVPHVTGCQTELKLLKKCTTNISQLQVCLETGHKQLLSRFKPQ